jgi:uncharacterized protein (TIGR00661 family)
MSHSKRILVCPLDWGLGHATRCVPIIRSLLNKNAEVIIAADKGPYELLKIEFPNLEFIRLPGYDISYSNGSMALKMLLSIPSILKGIRKEKNILQKIIAEKKIDIVISDNRYGCYSADCHNIFITHQLLIKSPFAERLLQKINSSFISRFDECWVPDLEGEQNLSGDLSHKSSIAVKKIFIGPLSRFQRGKSGDEEYEVMGIVSGPEPQRSIFEELLKEQLLKSGKTSLLLLGKPGEHIDQQLNGMRIISHLDSKAMQEALAGAKLIVARSGYSTIMDLVRTGKKAIFIPTPGQTEQEYLANYFLQKKVAYYQEQKKFDLPEAIRHSDKFSGFEFYDDSNKALETRIDELMLS